MDAPDVAQPDMLALQHVSFSVDDDKISRVSRSGRLICGKSCTESPLKESLPFTKKRSRGKRSGKSAETNCGEEAKPCNATPSTAVRASGTQKLLQSSQQQDQQLEQRAGQQQMGEGDLEADLTAPASGKGRRSKGGKSSGAQQQAVLEQREGVGQEQQDTEQQQQRVVEAIVAAAEGPMSESGNVPKVGKASKGQPRQDGQQKVQQGQQGTEEQQHVAVESIVATVVAVPAPGKGKRSRAGKVGNVQLPQYGQLQEQQEDQQAEGCGAAASGQGKVPGAGKESTRAEHEEQDKEGQQTEDSNGATASGKCRVSEARKASGAWQQDVWKAEMEQGIREQQPEEAAPPAYGKRKRSKSNADLQVVAAALETTPHDKQADAKSRKVHAEPEAPAPSRPAASPRLNVLVAGPCTKPNNNNTSKPWLHKRAGPLAPMNINTNAAGPPAQESGSHSSGLDFMGGSKSRGGDSGPGTSSQKTTAGKEGSGCTASGQGIGSASGGPRSAGLAAMFAASRAQPGAFRVAGLRKNMGNFKPVQRRN